MAGWGEHLTHSIIVDPGAAGALLAGSKTQMRVLAGSRLSACAAGDRMWVREACIPGRMGDGGEVSTDRRRAEFVVFPDGWRRYPDGSGHRGAVPVDAQDKWIGAMHMPRWACRMELVVEWTRAERLQAITHGDARAEGVRKVLGGVVWRLPKPRPGVFVSARRAFARGWDVDHPLAGARWADDPAVVVIGFAVVRV
jgi:hypothetical protein